MNPRSAAPPGVRLRFGEFELDARSLELWRNGEIVPLRPRPAQVLAALAEAAPAMLGHEDLHRLVWGEDLHLQLEQSLKSCIKQIRDALGDDAKHPRFIETLPRRGYRFLAAVEVVPATLGGPQSPTRRRLERVAGVLLVLAALGGVAYMVLEAVRTPEPVRSEEAAALTDRAGGVRVASAAYETWMQAQRVLGPAASASEVEYGVRLLRLAERLDPSFAPAPASLALVYATHRALPPPVRYPAALREAERALRLDPRSAPARLARGLVRFHYQLDWQGARADFEAAIAADPRFVDAHLALAGWFAARGEGDRARPLVDTARRLDPTGSRTFLACGWNLYYARDFDGALRDCGNALRLGGPSDDAARCVVLAGVAAGDLHLAAAGARLSLAAASTAMGAPATATGAAARPVIEMSDRQAIDRFLETWLERVELQVTLAGPPGERLPPLLLLNRRDEALATLAEVVRTRSAEYLPYLPVAPFLDPIRDDPRVRRLLDRIARGSLEPEDPAGTVSEKP